MTIGDNIKTTMRKLRQTLIAFLSILVSLSGSSHSLLHATQQTARSSHPNKAQKQKLQLLKREFPRLVDSALLLKNVELKVETLGRLADILWIRDESGARQLFQRTFDLLSAIEPADPNNSTSKSEESSSKMPPGKLVGLYVRFFARLSKHDKDWKDQLFKAAPEFLRTPGVTRNQDLSTANLLLNEKERKAFDFIEAATIDPSPGLADSLQLVELLLRSRLIDAKQADRLFLGLLRQLEHQSANADDLLTIGNYLFSGRPVNGAEDKVMISPVYVGRTAFHADIAYDRLGNSSEAIDAYLRTSASILSRPTSDEAVLLQNRAAAFLLLPKARRFATDLVPVLVNLSTGIDPTKTNSVEARASETTQADPQTPESVLEKLSSIKDPLQRDEYCLRMISAFYSRADFKSAEVLVSKMSSSDIREKLSSVISTALAIDSIRSGDLDSAQRLTSNLSTSKDKSFLSFAIADRLIEKGDLQTARIAVDNGLADARRTEGSTKASLLMLGTELVYRMDFVTGSSVLLEALKVIDSLEPDQDDPLRFDRFTRVKVGAQSATFSTEISGFKPGSVSATLKMPLSQDPSGTLRLIFQMKNEFVRSSAILASASELTSGT